MKAKLCVSYTLHPGPGKIEEDEQGVITVREKERFANELAVVYSRSSCDTEIVLAFSL
jgi:hypothetical protein